MSFSWLVVKKVNKFDKRALLNTHILLPSVLVSSKHVSVSATFQLCRLFVYCNAVEFNSRIIIHIVYTTKKCFSPDARDMVENIVANPTVI